jgi:hypothetical protein
MPHIAFTQIRNAWLRDRRISWKAKGLLGYLASHAEGYRLSQAQIIREATDGRDSVVTGLRELQAAGYLERNRERNRAGGRYSEDEYTLVDPFDLAGNLTPTEPRAIPLPYAEEPRETHQSGFSNVDNPHRETRPIEEQGENKPPPTEEGAPALRAVADEHNEIAALAHRLAAEHYEATGKLGGNRAFLAARQIIAGAVQAGHTPPQITAALASIRRRGRPLTNAVLGPLLADPRLIDSDTRGHAPYRNPPPGSYTDTAF